VHFDLFGALVRHGGPASAKDIADAVNEATQADGRDKSSIRK
jgi:hypothetical protein